MRLPYSPNPPTFENPEHQAFLERILKARGKHGLSPLDLALLHSPTLFKGFMQFFTAIRAKSTLPEDGKHAPMNLELSNGTLLY